MDLIGLRQKKAHIMEVQINGGTISDKVVKLIVNILQILDKFFIRLTGLWNILRRQFVCQKCSNKTKSSM